MSYESLDSQWGESWLEPHPVPQDLAAAIRQVTGGGMPVWASLLTPVPWVIRTFLRTIDKKLAHMPLPLFDLIALVVAQDNSCRYCYGATRAILKIQGFGDERIEMLERDLQLAKLTPAEDAAIRYARRVSQANPMPGPQDLQDLAAAGFTPPMIAEIVYMAAFAGYGNRVATLFALPPDQIEHLLDKPLMRLMRPLIARKMRGRPQPAVKLPTPNEPPFAELVATLDGSPTAYFVRADIDDAMASPVLTRRTKLLMCAVVGHALSCDAVTRETRRTLAAEGLSGAEIDEIVTNLGSPRLDEREQLLIPFARETVRYRNIPIQQRTRELGSRLGLDVAIEAVGMAALANSLARLSVLVSPC
ncbi:MAG TPA: hypothetical protein VGK20_01515 [Candidatus Binatia bacterium]|jgi:AhpD family alkylhydroperoxidase